MDPRVREQAEIVASHSIDLQPDDDVVIVAPAEASDLVVALHEVIGDRGANPVVLSSDDRAKRAYLRASDPEGFETPDHELALAEAMDAYVAIRSHANVTETSDVDPKTNAAHRQSHQPILGERLSKRWCLTQYPAPANAQLAEMSTEAYENFVWDAITKDWAAVREFQSQLVDILEAGDAVRIVSGDTTDVTMRIGDNPCQNDYGEHNLPGGEVFTAPVPDSVEGEVLFDKPLYHQGREVTGAYLAFEDGAVVDHRAEKNEEVLTEVLNTDDGARRLGELGIGMNRDIDRFTYNMLFDEKMGDTVHMAVGRAYEDTVAEGAERNESAVHVDMIVDMSEDSYIAVDGERVQEDGTFAFEE
jgi:aminopeptidase